MKQTFMIVAIAAGFAVPGAAQEQVRIPATAERRAAVEGELQAQDVRRARVAVETRTTRGRPYSAEAFTESTQLLGDGNRISRKFLTRIYRDTEGRTRREQQPVGAARDLPTIAITDPVAGTSFILEPDTRTAYRTPLPRAIPPVPPPPPPAGSMAPLSDEVARKEDETKARVELSRNSMNMSQNLKVAAERAAAGEGTTTREELGQQLIEGVMATGTRTTTIIAAGAIGNDQPIRTVSEQWFSPDLEVLVLTKHSDPRSGETIYRMSNIVRAEPDRSLFEVPADYTVKEPGIRRSPR
jgi:hypothetical protein